MPLLLLFVVLPGLELYVLIQAGDWIGGFNTFMLVILTGILGAGLVKNQGREIFFRIQSELAQGRAPADSLLNAFLIFVGGLFLLTPGFITDCIGLALVFPLTRLVFVNRLNKILARQLRRGNLRFYSSNGFSASWRNYSPQGGQEDARPHRIYKQDGHDVIDIDAEKN